MRVDIARRFWACIALCLLAACSGGAENSATSTTPTAPMPAVTIKADIAKRSSTKWLRSRGHQLVQQHAHSAEM